MSRCVLKEALMWIHNVKNNYTLDAASITTQFFIDTSSIISFDIYQQ